MKKLSKEEIEKKYPYAIIGGQYRYYSYGLSKTLTGAKRKASECIEYWDNWKGWNYPRIYKTEDTEIVQGIYGRTRRPKEGAKPIYTRIYGERWKEEK